METGRRDRLYLMDEIRGILILYVVLYHLLYDVSQIFYVGSIPWMYSPWMDGLRNVMVGMLIIIAGISCTLSRNNARRGLRILFVALCLTVVTAIAVPEELILFGILHFFGTAILIYSLLSPLLRRIPYGAGMAVSAYLFLATFSIYEGYFGFPYRVAFHLPESLLHVKVLYILGYAIEGLQSADYYPLMPWIFLLFFGGFLGRYLQSRRQPEVFYQCHSRVLGSIGRHTLLIYLVHQPVIYGVLYLISLFQ